MLLPFPKNSLWGFVNECGEWCLSPQYDDVTAFYEGTATVVKNGLWGTINARGVVIVPLLYSELEDFYDGLAVGFRKDMAVWQILKTTGDVLPLSRCKWAWNLGRGMICGCGVFCDDFVILREDGSRLNDIVYQEVLSLFDDNFIHCKRDGGFRIEDKRGRIVNRFDADGMLYFYGGKAVAWRGEKKGIIDANGNILMQFEYEWIEMIGYGSERFVLARKKYDEGLRLYEINTGKAAGRSVEDARHCSFRGEDYYWILRNGTWTVLNGSLKPLACNIGTDVRFLADEDGERAGRQSDLVLVKCKNNWRYHLIDGSIFIDDVR